MSINILKSRGAWLIVALVLGLGVLGWTALESRASDKPAKGWLGVSVEELTPSLRKKMKLGAQTGLLVTNVAENSPAEDAGIKEDDVIIQFDGKNVEEAGAFSRMVRDAGADQKVALVIMRAGERKTMEVMLGKRRSSNFGYAYNFGRGGAPGVFAFSARPRMGVQVHELDESLAAYFKVQPREGVLILEVNEDSPAEKAGFKTGDVITKVGEEKIRDAEDLIEALAEYEDGDKVNLEYVRQGKRANAEIEIEAPESFHRSWRMPHGDFGAQELRWEESEDPLIIRKIAPRIEMREIIRDEIDASVREEVEAGMRRAIDEARWYQERIL